MNIKEQLAIQAMYAAQAKGFTHAIQKEEKAKAVVPETPGDIAAMDKPEVIEWIEAHGGKADRRKGVDTLRDELTAMMFVSV